MIKRIALVLAACAFATVSANAQARPKRPTLADYGISPADEQAAAAAAAVGKKVSLSGGKLVITGEATQKPERVVLEMPAKPQLNTSTCELSKKTREANNARMMDQWRAQCAEVKAQQKKQDELYQLAMKEWNSSEAAKKAGSKK